MAWIIQTNWVRIIKFITIYFNLFCLSNYIHSDGYVMYLIIIWSNIIIILIVNPFFSSTISFEPMWPTPDVYDLYTSFHSLFSYKYIYVGIPQYFGPLHVNTDIGILAGHSLLVTEKENVQKKSGHYVLKKANSVGYRTTTSRLFSSVSTEECLETNDTTKVTKQTKQRLWSLQLFGVKVCELFKENFCTGSAFTNFLIFSFIVI